MPEKPQGQDVSLEGAFPIFVAVDSMLRASAAGLTKQECINRLRARKGGGATQTPGQLLRTSQLTLLPCYGRALRGLSRSEKAAAEKDPAALWCVLLDYRSSDPKCIAVSVTPAYLKQSAFDNGHIGKKDPLPPGSAMFPFEVVK